MEHTNILDQYKEANEAYIKQITEQGPQAIAYQIGHLSHIINLLSRELWQDTTDNEDAEESANANDQSKSQTDAEELVSKHFGITEEDIK